MHDAVSQTFFYSTQLEICSAVCDVAMTHFAQIRKRMATLGANWIAAWDGGRSTRGFHANHHRTFLVTNATTNEVVCCIPVQRETTRKLADGQTVVFEGNHEGSSHTMESAACVQAIDQLKESGILKYMVAVVADGDSKVPAELIESRSDIVVLHDEHGHFNNSFKKYATKIFGKIYVSLPFALSKFLLSLIKLLKKKIPGVSQEAVDLRSKGFNFLWDHAKEHFCSREYTYTFMNCIYMINRAPPGTETCDFGSIDLGDTSSSSYQPLSTTPPPKTHWQRLKERAEALGRVVVDVQGNGACYFNAISHQLCQLGLPQTPEEIRAATVNEIETNEDHYKRFFRGNDFDQWLLKIRVHNEWADQPCVQASCNAYRIIIHVIHSNDGYRSDEGNPWDYVHEPVRLNLSEDQTRDLTHLWIGYVSNSHYVSLPLRSSSDIPANSPNTMENHETSSSPDSNETFELQSYAMDVVPSLHSDTDARPPLSPEEVKELSRNVKKYVFPLTRAQMKSFEELTAFTKEKVIPVLWNVNSCAVEEGTHSARLAMVDESKFFPRSFQARSYIAAMNRNTSMLNIYSLIRQRIDATSSKTSLYCTDFMRWTKGDPTSPAASAKSLNLPKNVLHF